MTQHETRSPTATFEAARPRLLSLAYRMLGSRADAEDTVQECFVRWHQTDQSAVETPEAWLVTAVTRLAIDRLRRLKTERDAYVGPWLPEPIVGDEGSPDRGLDLASHLSLAMLTLLETLAPEERAAFLLHDVFEVDYGQIAGILGKNEASCRQVIHRARERVRGGRRFESDDSAHLGLIRKFKTAMETSDEKALLALFAPDATWIADGGGKTAAAGRPLLGAETIVRFALAFRRGAWPPDRVLELDTVNGQPGICVRDGDRLIAVLAFETAGPHIATVYAVLNPDKLAAADTA